MVDFFFCFARLFAPANTTLCLFNLILHFYFYTFDFRVFFLLSPMFILRSFCTGT